MSNIILEPIEKEGINMVWPVILPWLENALVKDGSYNTNDIRALCGKAITLWIIYIDTKPTGFVMTSFSQAAQGLTAYAPYLGGENLDQWVGEGFEQLKDYLKEKGCLSFSWIGRAAWKKLVKVDSAQCYYTINL